MSAPPPDARESALERLIEKVECDADTMLRHGLDCVTPATRELARGLVDNDLDLAAAARAEISALRASQGAVAREFVEAADALRAYVSHETLSMNWYRGPGEEPEYRLTNEYVEGIRELLAAYDALRPAATGEGDIDATLDEIEGVLNEFFGANRDEERDTRPLREQLRAAIARAKGRKGT